MLAKRGSLTINAVTNSIALSADARGQWSADIKIRLLNASERIGGLGMRDVMKIRSRAMKSKADGECLENADFRLMVDELTGTSSKVMLYVSGTRRA